VASSRKGDFLDHDNPGVFVFDKAKPDWVSHIVRKYSTIVKPQARKNKK
jgi:hypothetical protein